MREPDTIDQMNEQELRAELRAVLVDLGRMAERETETLNRCISLERDSEALQSRLSSCEKENELLKSGPMVAVPYLSEVQKKLAAAESRLEEALNTAEELREKGRRAWEVLERYLADAHSLDLNAFPGSDDMLVALTGIRFQKPTAADLEAFKRDLVDAGVVERHEHEWREVSHEERECACGARMRRGGEI